MSVTPKNIKLVGTRGDDIYYNFENFTLGGVNYPADAVPELYMELISDANTNYTSTGTLDKSKVTFKIPSASNAVVGVYKYDVHITYANGDKFTHIIGEINISDDVNKN